MGATSALATKSGGSPRLCHTMRKPDIIGRSYRRRRARPSPSRVRRARDSIICGIVKPCASMQFERAPAVGLGAVPAAWRGCRHRGEAYHGGKPVRAGARGRAYGAIKAASPIARLPGRGLPCRRPALSGMRLSQCKKSPAEARLEGRYAKAGNAHPAKHPIKTKPQCVVVPVPDTSAAPWRAP
jgi:hypothetical protein